MRSNPRRQGRNHSDQGWSRVESLTSPGLRRREDFCARTESSSDCGPTILSELPECAIPLDCNQYIDASRGSSCCDGPHRYRNGGVRETYYEGFRVTLSPLNNVVTPLSDHNGMVEFKLRRKNKVVTMQWESFSGTITQNGGAFLSVNQSFSNLPDLPVNMIYMLEYRGVAKVSYIRVDPNSSVQVKFYLDVSGHGSDVKVGDLVEVPGGCVSWITCT